MSTDPGSLGPGLGVLGGGAGAGLNTWAKQQPTTGDMTKLILSLLVEGGGLAFITIVAGTSDEAATLMLVFVVGVWMLWLIRHPQVGGYVNNLFTNVGRITSS